MFDRDRWRNSANVVDPRFVHALEELAHVRTEGFDVTALPFGIDGVESERRLSAPARAGDHAQLSKRKIEIDAFEVILARPADFNAPALSQSSDDVFFPVARTHWRQSFHAMRSANSVESPPVRGRHPERKRGTSLKLVEEVAESLTVCAVRDDGMEAEEESSEGVRT